MFDHVLLKRVVAQPTKKLRNVCPHKSKLTTTTNNQEICLKNKKFRSESIQLREGFTKPDNDAINIQ